MADVKVWLVGAGPGDAGLLTLRGYEVLKRAETVIYDRLIGEGLFQFFPDSAELIDVGKEGGYHKVPQRQIERILVEKAQEGKLVVRLKGGDPFLFGRGGEEAEALIEAGIPFEIVPGVTSAIAVPAYAGIPVTHRGFASSLHIITGHVKESGGAELNYKAMVSSGGTLVFLMGVGRLAEICEKLISGGMNKNSPAAVIEHGTTASQRSITGTLDTLPGLAEGSRIKSPSVIVVGDVAALGRLFAWKKYLPLSGKRVLVTRPAEKSGELSRMLRDKGAEVIELACIKTITLDVALPAKLNYDWIAFTSAFGVESFFELLRRSKRDVREIGAAKIAAIGKATAKALEARGLTVNLMPEIFDGVHLGNALADLAKGESILLPRAKDGSRELNNVLLRAGIAFDEIAVYKTVYENGKFTPTDIDLALFTSASSVRALTAACPGGTFGAACCIGVRTAEAAKAAGFDNIRIAAGATLKDLIKEAEMYAK